MGRERAAGDLGNLEGDLLKNNLLINFIITTEYNQYEVPRNVDIVLLLMPVYAT